jgi:hypothetical protein
VTFQLAPFTEQQTIDYASKWFAQERRLVDQQAPEWAATFAQESAAIPDLRSNPLMLALLCILYRGEGSLPRNRPAVYERCSTLLFETWDSSRKIYVNLRARDLIEPVLRHLAYWLLTRNIPSPVVTEEQLIDETARYLQDRRYEDIDEATRAAREFVEFCKGRAWVFAEVGTSAAGDPLFTFSHRTFLEYFAAAYLASICDTPERLASTLGTHIARGEWDVVAELALQIKSRQIRDGATRFYTALLLSRKYSAINSLRNLTSFLARCLSFVDVPPSIVRELVDRSFRFIIQNPENNEQIIPLGLIMSVGPLRAVVYNELAHQISEATRADNDRSELTALRVALELDHICWIAQRSSRSSSVRANMEYWRNQSAVLGEIWRQKIVELSGGDEALLISSYLRNWIQLRQIDEWPIGAWKFLFRGDVTVGIGVASWIDPASIVTSNIAAGSQNPDFHVGVRRLEDVFDLIRSLGSPPWPIDDALNLSLRLVENDVDINENFILETSKISREAWTAALILSAILYEGSSLLGQRSNLERDQEVTLGSLTPLVPYIKCREAAVAGNGPTAVPGPLNISEDFQDMFEAWASGKLNFIMKYPAG